MNLSVCHGTAGLKHSCCAPVLGTVASRGKSGPLREFAHGSSGTHPRQRFCFAALAKHNMAQARHQGSYHLAVVDGSREGFCCLFWLLAWRCLAACARYRSRWFKAVLAVFPGVQRAHEVVVTAVFPPCARQLPSRWL